MPKMKILKYLSLLILAILAGCSQINKASDFIANPTAKQKYQRDFDISDELYALWESQADSALQDSISIDLPYSEQGKFKPRESPVYAYEISLKPGEILEVETQTDSVKNLVFIDLFQQKNDSVFENIQSSKFQKNQLVFEPEEKGTYKLLIQPEIEAHTAFSFHIKKRPAYIFPVAATRNEAIQSYWGAAREGGARSHEGIDIFADRGSFSRYQRQDYLQRRKRTWRKAGLAARPQTKTVALLCAFRQYSHHFGKCKCGRYFGLCGQHRKCQDHAPAFAFRNL